MCEKRKPVAGGGVALGLQSYQYEEITKDKYLSQHKRLTQTQRHHLALVAAQLADRATTGDREAAKDCRGIMEILAFDRQLVVGV